MTATKTYKHVSFLWDHAHVAKLSPVEQLIYRSNLLGMDPRITNTRGGNTSAKFAEKDPMTGAAAQVMWVKGSGGDLRTATVANFSSLYMDRLMSLQSEYAAASPKGAKTPIEDSMVGKYLHCNFNLNPCVPSIDTPLHAFIPRPHVDHMHPNAIIGIAASKNGEKLTREIFGDEVLWTNFQRPGFDLGLQFQELYKANPKAKGFIMQNHGFISWADDGFECYVNTLDIIEKAANYFESKDLKEKAFGGAKVKSLSDAERRATFIELLPWMRGQICQKQRMVATIHDDAAILEFVNSKDAGRLVELGSSCPDHFLRTKFKPLFVNWDPQKQDLTALKSLLVEGMVKYREDYAKYYQANKESYSPALRDANPTVFVIPGLGQVAWGKDKVESRVTGEFYLGAVQVLRAAESVDSYLALAPKDAFDIEYWPLEEAKLKRMPPEKELSRQIVAVIGAGSGIGKELVARIAKEGAQVVCADLQLAPVVDLAKDIAAKHSILMGASGTGESDNGISIGLAVDLTDRKSIRQMLEKIILAYGGLDSLAITAGIFVPPDASGRIADDKWDKTFAINTTAIYLAADEANAIWAKQGLKGSLVVTTSANAVVAKKGSLAYDVSKAAANHLVRELAIELAPTVRVNAVAPATVVQGSSMFPRERVMSSLAKYGLPCAESDSTEVLTGRLSQFYADRTLTKQPITMADQAEAMYLLLTQRLSKTTGQVIPVDGGLADGFMR